MPAAERHATGRADRDLSSPAGEIRVSAHDYDLDFYGRLPVFTGFTQLTDPAIYTPLPDGWVLGMSDIVQSTAAIDAGRYKAVNTAAAAIIAAVANALPDPDFPFVFDGDGASFALPPESAELGRKALAAVAAWVRDDLDMQMRVAVVPVAAVRANGFDVRVARFAPSRPLGPRGPMSRSFCEVSLRQDGFGCLPTRRASHILRRSAYRRDRAQANEARPTQAHQRLAARGWSRLSMLAPASALNCAQLSWL